MTIAEYYEHIRKNCTCRSNKIYDIIFYQFDKKEIYVEQIFIKPEYRGRGYLKKIFTDLCKEFNCSLIFQCYEELIPMYEHIGAFHYSANPHGLVEMYFDPLQIVW